MGKNPTGVTLVEISMAFVVLAIVAVVALPAMQSGGESQSKKWNSVNTDQALEKVKSAYANAIANKGGYPRLYQVVDFIDADFASENNSLSGIVFKGRKKREIVKTYNDEKCIKRTSGVNPGVSDIVRCIDPGVDA